MNFKISLFLFSVFGFLGFQQANLTTVYDFKKLFRFPDKIENNYNPVTQEGALLGRYLFYDNMQQSSVHLSLSLKLYIITYKKTLN